MANRHHSIDRRDFLGVEEETYGERALIGALFIPLNLH
jgi:hypothetical protein